MGVGWDRRSVGKVDAVGKWSLALAALCGGAAGGRWVFERVVAGQLTLDVGWKRTVRQLGPLVAEVDAPRDTVFDVIADPYLGRSTRAMADKLRVIERGSDMVLAEHVTAVGDRRAVTLETVRFERPDTVSFRLVRGPVPSVTESFVLSPGERATTLRYGGELATDGGRLGSRWGELVARQWEQAVRSSMAAIQREAERRAGGQPATVDRAPGDED